MALDENDATKHDKLIALKLTTNEWECVELFLGLLVVCVFSYHFVCSSIKLYLACRQRPTSLFVRSGVNASPWHACSRGALQGMVITSGEAQVCAVRSSTCEGLR